MTEKSRSTEDARCAWCRRLLPARDGVGRKRTYCRQSCRQRAYEARQQAAALGLSEHELVITRQELERLQDLAFVLQGAVINVDRSIGDDADVIDLRKGMKELLDAARPLTEAPLI